MTGKEIFKIWAPVGAKWVDWVRPVPFIALNDNFTIHEVCDFNIQSITYINELLKDTALIIDLPSYESVKEGIAVSQIGYRPIPIYNGTDAQKGAISTVENNAIEGALVWGATKLQNLKIDKDAPPAFLLDSNRMHRFKMDVSVFDNSWDIYDQDIPSAEYFLKNGINKIIVRSMSIQKDLNKILYKFQNKGIKILFTNGYEEVKEIKLKKPSHKDK